MFKFNELGPIIVVVGDKATDPLNILSYFYNDPARPIMVNECRCPSLAMAHQLLRFSPVEGDPLYNLMSLNLKKEDLLKSLVKLTGGRDRAAFLFWIQQAPDAQTAVNRGNQLSAILYQGAKPDDLDVLNQQSLVDVTELMINARSEALTALKATENYCIVYDNFDKAPKTDGGLGWGKTGLGDNLFGMTLMIVRNSLFSEQPSKQVENVDAYYRDAQQQRCSMESKYNGKPLYEMPGTFLIPYNPTLLKDLINCFEARVSASTGTRYETDAKQKLHRLMQSIQLQSIQLIAEKKLPLVKATPVGELSVARSRPLVVGIAIPSGFSLPPLNNVSVVNQDPIDFIQSSEKNLTLVNPAHRDQPLIGDSKDWFSLESQLFLTSTLGVSIPLEAYQDGKGKLVGLNPAITYFAPMVTLFRLQKRFGYLTRQPDSYTTFSVIHSVPFDEHDKITVPKDHYLKTVQQRIQSQFNTAFDKGCKNLVIPAFGCGTYENDAADIAQCYRNVINAGNYAQRFDSITFTISASENSLNYQLFVEKIHNSIDQVSYPSLPVENAKAVQEYTLPTSHDVINGKHQAELAKNFFSLRNSIELLTVFHQVPDKASEVLWCFSDIRQANDVYTQLCDPKIYDLADTVKRQRAVRIAPVMFPVCDGKYNDYAIVLKKDPSQYKQFLEMHQRRADLIYYIKQIFMLFDLYEKAQKAILDENARYFSDSNKKEYCERVKVFCDTLKAKLVVAHAYEDIHAHVGSAVKEILESKQTTFLDPKVDTLNARHCVAAFQQRVADFKPPVVEPSI